LPDWNFDFSKHSSLYYNPQGLGGLPCPFKPIAICGPAGVGKRTLTRMLIREYPQVFRRCVSHTTRKPRPGENNGQDYNFCSIEEMSSLIKAGKMIFVTTFCGQQYGIAFDAFLSVRNEGKIALIEVELEVRFYHVPFTPP
jgi:guanylate kinase